jgi:hypothetical protein
MRDLAGQLAVRIQEIRRELFGEEGIPSLAEAMKLPARTWKDYEAGADLPATFLLGFLEVTGADPKWLLTGRGERYLARPERRNGQIPAWGPRPATQGPP